MNRSTPANKVFAAVMAIQAATLLPVAFAQIPPTTGPALYVEPDLRAWIFDAAQMKTPPDARARIAQLLTLHVANDLQYHDPNDYAAAARVLGIALRIDPSSKPAVLANAALRRGRKPAGDAPAGWGKKSFTTELVQLAGACKTADTPADRTAAAYLFDIVLGVDPDNEDALYEHEVLKQAEVKVEWSWADPSRPGAVATGRAGGAGPAIAPPPAVAGGGAAAGTAPVAPDDAAEVGRFTGHRGPVDSLAFLPDGKSVVSTASDRFVRLWRTTTGEEVRRFDAAEGFASSVRVSADGSKVVALAEKAVWVWETATGKVLQQVRLDKSATSLALTPDAGHALVSDRFGSVGPTRLLDLKTGKPVGGVPADVRPGRNQAAVSPDGKFAAVVTADRLVVTWSLADLTSARVLSGHSKPIDSLVFSPDGRLLATAGQDGDILLWDVRAGVAAPPIRVGVGVTGLAFSPDGRSLAGLTNSLGADGRVGFLVRIWDVGAGREVFRYAAAASLDTAAFSPDGRFLAAGGQDGQVHVWQTPRALAAPPARVAEAKTSAGSPDAIERPEFRNRAKSVLRRQSTLKGLVVRRSDGGDQYGFATDVILTVAPGRDPAPAQDRWAAKFARPVGPAMQSSLQEAERAIRLRYPVWDAATFDVSFEDKYSPLDGGSAGTAFGLLLLSALEGFEPDRTFAVTGDITVDWRVRKIGGVAAKIRGATLDGCKAVLIPAENELQADDLLVAQGDKPFWGIQVFTAGTLQEAVATARADRAKPVGEAMEQFRQLQQEHARAPAAFRTPAGIDRLSGIVTQAPNHLSARTLLRLARGQTPDKLTASASLFEAFTAVAEARPLVRDATNLAPTRARLPAERAKAIRDRLAAVRGFSHPDVVPLIDSLSEFVRLCDRLADPGGDAAARTEQLDLLRTQREAIGAGLLRLETNHNLMEQMLREGI